jgi:high-affinity Fe2+/Pb2+ permease
MDSFWIGAIAGVFIGAAAGWFLCCLMVAGGGEE